MIIRANLQVSIAMTSEESSLCHEAFCNESRTSIPNLSGKWLIKEINRSFSGDYAKPWIIDLDLIATSVE